MKINKMVEMLEKHGDFVVYGVCVDCGKDVAVSVSATDTGEIAIAGGALYEPPERYGYDNKYVCKCDACFKTDAKVHQKNEIYTRCVGYYRPTSQMNPGKLSEVKTRKPFTISN